MDEQGSVVDGDHTADLQVPPVVKGYVEQGPCSWAHGAAKHGGHRGGLGHLSATKKLGEGVTT